jgi:hypothetical protein
MSVMRFDAEGGMQRLNHLLEVRWRLHCVMGITSQDDPRRTLREQSMFMGTGGGYPGGKHAGSVNELGKAARDAELAYNDQGA